MLVAGLIGVQGFAQTNVNMPTVATPAAPPAAWPMNAIAPPGVCFFNFYDNGGPAAAYSAAQGGVMAFCPATPATHRIRATFSAFSTESGWDALYVYNGNTLAPANLIASGNGAPAGAPSPFGNAGAGGFWGTAAPGGGVVTSTAADGCLTFAFDSDGSVQSAGWAAVINQVPITPCVLTAPAAINTGTGVGATTCAANVTTPAPTFAPVGCNSAYSLQYRINGGAAVVIGAVVPATVTIAVPVGPSVITWQLVDPCGNAVVSSGTQAITVVDNTPPVVGCPANITINLNPGECAAQYSYNVSATDNCPFTVSGTVTVAQVGSNAFNGITFDVRNDGGVPFTITGFTAPISAGAHPVEAYYTTSASTAVGNQSNAAAWTLMGSANVVGVGGFPTWPSMTAVPIGGLVLNPGQTKGIYLAVTDGGEFGYMNGNFTTTNGTLTVISNGHSGGQYPFVNINTPRAFFGSVTYANTVDPLTQTAGLPSGSEFPVGTTTNCFTAQDLAGNTSTCCFSVTVVEYPNAITSLTCNDLVQISLDENCSATVGADQILEGGPYGCYDNYLVQFDKTAPFGNGPWLPNVLGPSDIGKTYQVKVTDPNTGNSCWGTVKIEDKLAPVLECDSALVFCNMNTAPGLYPTGAGTGTFAASCTLPLVVNDLETKTCQIPVSIPSNCIVNDVNFGIRATGDVWLFNFRVTLTNPGGASVVIWDQVGGCGALPFWAVFDDEGSAALTCANFSTGVNATIPFGFGTMSQVEGGNANGNWTVKIEELDAFGDVLNFEDMFLEINYTCLGATFPNQLVLNTNVFPNGTNSYVASAGAGIPTLEPCSDVTLTYLDATTPLGCATGLTKQINRKWTARDASGNTATCIQVIQALRPELSDVGFPPSYDGIANPAFVCGVAPSNPAAMTPDYIEGLGLQGYPYVFGEPDGCSINWTYNDDVIHVCDGTYKIRRVWVAVDWCTGTDAEHVQIIKVLDEVGPAISCPANLTVSTDPYACCAVVDMPDVIIEDACSRIDNISGMIVVRDPQTGNVIDMISLGGSLTSFPGNNYWDLDTLGAYGLTSCLPLGTHTVTYMAEDNCGNTSACTFNLTVRDYTPPSVSCQTFTTVAIGTDDPYDCYVPNAPNAACEFGGVTWVKASSFNSGTYDNCGSYRLTIQRMAPYSDCINNLNQVNGHPNCDDVFPDFPSEFERAITEGDSIKFYCCEVGTTQTVVLRAYQLDASGFFSIGPDGQPIVNSCMIDVEVQDKIKPICVSPSNVTVTCENFDPSLWAYGTPTPYDNCCLDITKEYNGRKGITHSVNYSLFDTVCNRGTITRTFRVYDCHGLSNQCTQRVVVTYNQDYWIKFPDDKIITVCDGSGTYGEPTIFDEDCELVAISYSDDLYTVVPDACYKIERTWSINNWCTYNPNSPCIYVPNPNPNPTINHPSNLPGPVVGPGIPNQNPANTVVKINPTDPLATNFGTFWSATANCYQYKQIIKVIDTQDPVIANCPASPVEICDLTANDNQMWNQQYWWDQIVETHDLCEAPTDLNITATDLCSGAQINARYLLFLDLDGNGSMETVVSSQNVPAAGTVNYNNALNPNFGGGEVRTFDGRPVSPNQLYRFALQSTTSGTNRTFALRWNTIASPNSYAVPQLPHGTHKIKWFVEDGCGNESVCEYTFVVKDCKKPTVVCYNGLSVNIMQTGMVTIWDTDFLQYAEDNCTPADKLKIGIRKSGSGTGFPVDQHSVTFDCTELGPQYVELWAQDLAGNADFCETYILVQDNMGNCPTGAKSVAGALKSHAPTTPGLEAANVDLYVANPNPALPPASMFDLTDDQGHYEFSQAVPVQADAVLTPVKDDDHLNGVSTLDLLLINRHILGQEPLNTPFKQIAADANKSGTITTFDIVELRKLILGIYNELPNNTSWRFVDNAFVFPDPSNPFSTQFPEVKSLQDVTSSMMDENFVAVKIGDVNNTAIANSLMSADDRTAGQLLFDVEDRTVKAGEEFNVTFKASENVAGYQFTMNTPNLDVVNTNLKAENFAVFADRSKMTLSQDGENISEFTVTFRAKAEGQISKLLGVSNSITTAEAYNNNGDRLAVALRFNGSNGSIVSGAAFELFQNTPNPFVTSTNIAFFLPEATEATLKVYDESGRMLLVKTGEFAKGKQFFQVQRSEVSATGVLYYTVETATDSATKKMIQTK